MDTLNTTAPQVMLIRVDDPTDADRLAEFFRRPYYNLDAVLSASDRHWLPLLKAQRDAVQN